MVLFRLSGDDGAEVSPGCHVAQSPIKLATFYSHRASSTSISGTAQVGRDMDGAMAIHALFGTPANHGNCQAPALVLSDLAEGGACGDDSSIPGGCGSERSPAPPRDGQWITRAGDGGRADTAQHPARKDTETTNHTTMCEYERRLAGMSKIVTDKERDALLCGLPARSTSVVEFQPHQRQYREQNPASRGDKHRALAASRGAFARWARTAFASACAKQVLMGASVQALLRQAAFRRPARR